MLHMVKWDFGAFRSPRRFASDMKALFPTDIPHDPQDNMWNREMVKGFSKRALYEKLPFSEPSINEPEITPMAYGALLPNFRVFFPQLVMDYYPQRISLLSRR